MTLTAQKPSLPSFQIRLLGGFEVRLPDGPLPSLRSRREQWLLALLLLRHDRDTARDWLAATLWPDAEPQQALFYLRKALSNLRQALGAEAVRLLAPTPRTLRLDMSHAFADVLAFDHALKQALASPDPTPALQEAIALYRGPLLPDCQEEWANVERNQRAEAYLSALESLAARLYAQGEPRAAVPWLRLLLDADPYRESACLLLMQALADCGDPAAVTVVYQELRARLRQDLNADPAPETEALYRRLRQQQRTPLVAAAAPSPASDAPSTRRHLPVPLSDLLGRQEVIVEILHVLKRCRLLTLVGAGGVGKTRLGIAVAEAALPRFGQGVWFVDLAPLSEEGLVPQAVAKALGITEQAGRSLTEVLSETLATQSLLVVLDNCEHLPDACAELAHTLLLACPWLCLVATSRQPLGVAGEQVYRVPSLGLPSPEGGGAGSETERGEKDPHVLMEYAGVRLFVERAVASQRGFRLHRRNAEAVGEICRQLDGIPLAIEMAAVRLRSLTVGEIRSRLADRFRLLSGGNRGVLPRQQTLRAAIDWSYDLLEVRERTLLRRLCVFAGGFTGEAAEEVCGEGMDGDVGVRDTLASLVDRSLVVRREADEETVRYGMLESIRQYGWELLEGSGERAGIRRRHRDYFLTLAETLRPQVMGSERVQVLSILDGEHDNLRQALAFCKEEPGEAVRGLQLAVDLQPFWQGRGLFREGREHYAALLALPIPEEASGVRADALRGAGILAAIQSDLALAWNLMQESLTIQRELGNRQGIANTLHNLGRIAYYQADYVSARSLFQESLTLRQDLGDRQGIAIVSESLGNVADKEGDHTSARSLYQESLTIRREHGDRLGMVNTLNNLGNAALYQADYASARSLYEESLTLSKESGDRLAVANTLNNLASMHMEQADYLSAYTLFQESLAIKRELGARQSVADTLHNLGSVLLDQGNPQEACAFYEEALQINRELGNRGPEANNLAGLGNVALFQDDYPLARARHQESLMIRREVGDRWQIACSFESFADLAHTQESHVHAARLWGAASVLREGTGPLVRPNRLREIAVNMAAVREAMGEVAFAAAWAEGCAMTGEQAIDAALTDPFPLREF